MKTTFKTLVFAALALSMFACQRTPDRSDLEGREEKLSKEIENINENVVAENISETTNEISNVNEATSKNSDGNVFGALANLGRGIANAASGADVELRDSRFRALTLVRVACNSGTSGFLITVPAGSVRPQ